MGQTALSESLRSVEAEIAARQPERALVLGQDVQARYPRALAVQRVIGEVYLALRKTREAIGALDRALAGNPEDARACCARAIVQQIQGDSMGALAWYRRACDIRPGDHVLLSAYRELALSLNQPPYTPSPTGLARLYVRGDLFAHAIREWESILAERPDSLEAQVGLAETFWRAHDIPAAAERCRRLLMNSPSCVKALLILAAIEHDARGDEEAQQHLRRVAELDPDMRIARELFLDRLVANDRALSRPVFGEEPPPQRVASVPLAQSAVHTSTAAPVMAGSLTGAPAGTRPGVPSRPAEQYPSAPASQPLAPAAQMGTGAPVTSQPQVTAGPRSGNLPPDFHRIFSETRDMLWHDDAEAQETQTHVPSAPAFDRSRVDPFTRSQVAIPPALLNQGGSLEDTEARLSLNFLNWLQAQGAVSQNAAALDVQGHTGPVPLPTAPRANPLDRAQGEPRFPFGQRGEIESPPTGPLPPPTPEALRAMFAELEPETASRRIVDADVVAAHDGGWDRDSIVVDAVPQDVPISATSGQLESEQEAADGHRSNEHVETAGTRSVEDIETGELSMPPPSHPASFASGPLMPPAGASHAPSQSEAPWWATANADTGSPELERRSGATESVAWGTTANPAGSALTPDSARDGRHGSGDSPATLESLERSFAGSGFEEFELRPGELAAIAAQIPSDTPSERPASANGETPERERDSSEFAAPPSPPEPPVPAPDDYPGRLDLARERRAAGKLDDALGEYRIILKNAPDLLGDVMSELNESLAAAPDHPEVHRLLGDAHIRQGDYLSALESYNRAVALTQAQGG